MCSQLSKVTVRNSYATQTDITEYEIIGRNPTDCQKSCHSFHIKTIIAKFANPQLHAAIMKNTEHILSYVTHITVASPGSGVTGCIKLGPNENNLSNKNDTKYIHISTIKLQLLSQAVKCLEKKPT